MSAPVSVVIATYEEGGELAGTVDSLLGADTAPREIVIVDDGSTDGSCERSWPPAVRVLRQPHRGIASARNRGAAAATQPNLVFLDAHCAVDDDWLAPLIDGLERAPDALVGPAVRDAREPRFVGVGAELVNALFVYLWLPVTRADIVEVGLVPGGCMAVRRERFAAAGGFGAFHGVGVEDVELALRWWRGGGRLLAVPASLVTHRFAARPAYRPDEQAWLYNVLRTALLHLGGAALRNCVTSCAQFAPFPGAIAAALAEPWLALHRSLEAREVRAVATYLDVWAPHAFAGPPSPR